MDAVFKIMILVYLTILVSCRRWDPNTQFLREMSQKQEASSNRQKFPPADVKKDLKLGQSLSEVIKIIGSDYKISGTLNTHDTNWLKIEFSPGQEEEKSSRERTELVFKNNLLIKIY